MSHIFISYSHKDKKYVEKLEKKLIEEGFNVWIDHRIDFGSRWTAEIEKAIDTCDAYIVVMSEDAKKSEWVQREVIHAERRRKPFFPLLLSGEFWFSLGDIQYVDITNGTLPPEKFYRRLEKVTPRKKIEKTVHPIAVIKQEPKLPKLFIDPKIVVRVIGAIILGFIAIFGIPKLMGIIGQIQFLSSEPTVASIKTQIVNPTFTPKTVINTPNSTRTPNATSTQNATYTPTVTSTPKLEIGLSWTRPEDGMVMMYVPAGEFQMGSENGSDDEKPVHTVYLDAFWIDQTEVTNSMYVICLDEEVCDDPGGGKRSSAEVYPNHPANGNWEMASVYCQWTGGRLPTEAEWEKAARGGMEGKKYPWGNESPTCQAGAKNGACANGPALKVKSFSQNGYGLYDVAGNVLEWVADWYAGDYYSNSPSVNPTGPSSGYYRVLRSGEWNYKAIFDVRTASRNGLSPGFSNHIGFRCARSATP